MCKIGLDTGTHNLDIGEETSPLCSALSKLVTPQILLALPLQRTGQQEPKSGLWYDSGGNLHIEARIEARILQEDIKTGSLIYIKMRGSLSTARTD
jgi:hypothetical protein